MKGIDISEWQNSLQLKKAMDAGYEFAILRGGFTGYGSERTKKKDACFEDFYKQAKALNMPVGAYWYSCADSTEQGKLEAEFFYENCLKGKQFEFPIYIDVEDEHWQVNSKSGVTDAVIAFCEALEDKGFFVGVYSSIWWFKNRMDVSRLTDYSKWIAAWTDQVPSPDFNGFDMWQYSSEVKVGNMNIDGDQAFVDFPDIIINAGLNGFKKVVYEPVAHSVDVQAIVDQSLDLIDEFHDIIDEATDIVKQLKDLLEQIS